MEYHVKWNTHIAHSVRIVRVKWNRRIHQLKKIDTFSLIFLLFDSKFQYKEDFESKILASVYIELNLDRKSKQKQSVTKTNEWWALSNFNRITTKVIEVLVSVNL